MRMIDVEQLSLSFGQGPGAARVLHDVSFSVAQGESFGLVGESGSGKTTLLRCLAGQFMHWSGALRLGEQPLGRTFDRARARRVQMVFQDPYGSLHPRHTVQTTLAEPLKIHQMDGQDQRIGTMLRKVGLDDSFRHRYPHQLSGGQKQRVAIARALILEPRVLLLDEPTSALDVSVQAEILNLLASLRKQEGLTYLLVTHDLGVVAHLCDRVGVMQQGRIVETIDTASLCSGAAQHAYTQMLVETTLMHGLHVHAQTDDACAMPA